MQLSAAFGREERKAAGRRPASFPSGKHREQAYKSDLLLSEG
jgi:hypothetical protein